MAKKKQTPHIISEEKQLEALETIAKMPPEQQQELLAFAEEFEQMPEEIQNMMVDFICMIDQMPKSEKEEFMQHMEHLDSILNGDATVPEASASDKKYGDSEASDSAEYDIDTSHTSSLAPTYRSLPFVSLSEV